MTKHHNTDTPIITDYDQDGFTIDHIRFDSAIAILGADAVGYTITDITLSNHGMMTPDDLNIFSSLDGNPHLLIMAWGGAEPSVHRFTKNCKK